MLAHVRKPNVSVSVPQGPQGDPPTPGRPRPRQGPTSAADARRPSHGEVPAEHERVVMRVLDSVTRRSTWPQSCQDVRQGG